MISPQSIILVYRIHDKTLNDSLCWQETVDEGVYQVALQNSTIKICRIPSNDGDEDIFIRVYNQKTTLIEEISDEEFGGKADRDEMEGKYPYIYLNELYEKARSQALGVEKVINDILLELRDDPMQNTNTDDIPF